MSARCFTCDKKLTFECNTNWQQNPVPPCPDCGGKRYYNAASKNYSYVKDGVPEVLPARFYCSRCCENEPAPKGWRARTLVSRERYHDKPGPYGDGYFCSLKCAHVFAVACAKSGMRLVGGKKTTP